MEWTDHTRPELSLFSELFLRVGSLFSAVCNTQSSYFQAECMCGFWLVCLFCLLGLLCMLYAVCVLPALYAVCSVCCIRFVSLSIFVGLFFLYALCSTSPKFVCSICCMFWLPCMLCLLYMLCFSKHIGWSVCLVCSTFPRSVLSIWSVCCMRWIHCMLCMLYFCPVYLLCMIYMLWSLCLLSLVYMLCFYAYWLDCFFVCSICSTSSLSVRRLCLLSMLYALTRLNALPLPSQPNLSALSAINTYISYGGIDISHSSSTLTDVWLICFSWKVPDFRIIQLLLG